MGPTRKQSITERQALIAHAVERNQRRRSLQLKQVDSLRGGANIDLLRDNPTLGFDQFDPKLAKVCLVARNEDSAIESYSYEDYAREYGLTNGKKQQPELTFANDIAELKRGNRSSEYLFKKPESYDFLKEKTEQSTASYYTTSDEEYTDGGGYDLSEDNASVASDVAQYPDSLPPDEGAELLQAIDIREKNGQEYLDFLLGDDDEILNKVAFVHVDVEKDEAEYAAGKVYDFESSRCEQFPKFDAIYEENENKHKSLPITNGKGMQLILTESEQVGLEANEQQDDAEVLKRLDVEMTADVDINALEQRLRALQHDMPVQNAEEQAEEEQGQEILPLEKKKSQKSGLLNKLGQKLRKTRLVRDKECPNDERWQERLDEFDVYNECGLKDKVMMSKTKSKKNLLKAEKEL